MKYLRFLLLLAVGLVGSGSILPAAPVALPEDFYPELKVLLADATRQSPRMVSRTIDLELAEQDRISARAGLLPSLGGSYTREEARDKREDLPNLPRFDATKTYYNISVSQPLYYWGERRNNARLGEIRQQITVGNYREAYRNLAQEIRSQYLGLVVKKAYLARARFNLQYTKDLLAVAEDRLAKKVIAGPEIFAFRLNAERAEIEAERAEFDYNSAREAFGRLTGRAAPSDASIPAEVPAVPNSGDALEKMLAVFLVADDLPTTEAANMRHSLKIEDLNLANARTRLKPKVSLSAGVRQDQQSYTINTSQRTGVNSQFISVSVYWTIFDGFSSQAAVRSSLLRKRQLENDYKVATERLLASAQSQVRHLDYARRYKGINERFLDSAQSTLKSKREEFARGVISETDVSAAELGFMDARITAFNSRIDYLLKSGDFLGTVAQDPVLENLNTRP
jgi:outer membrane protein TolC